MQRITLANRRYGYRRVTAELRRQGFTVNHKKVLRLMRNDNLLAIRKRRYVLTTDSDQHRAIYPNWAKNLQIDGLDQLWQADISYVRMRRSFVYLAVVMDSYSRRVVGWELGPSLEAILAVNALRKAIEFRCPKPGLVHHSPLTHFRSPRGEKCGLNLLFLDADDFVLGFEQRAHAERFHAFFLKHSTFFRIFLWDRLLAARFHSRQERWRPPHFCRLLKAACDLDQRRLGVGRAEKRHTHWQAVNKSAWHRDVRIARARCR